MASIIFSRKQCGFYSRADLLKKCGISFVSLLLHPFMPCSLCYSTLERENCAIKYFHSGERFQRFAFAVPKNSGYALKEDENGSKSLRFQKISGTV